MTDLNLSGSILAFVIIVVFAVTAYALETVTVFGAVAAAVIGSNTFLGFGARGFLLLVVFFVSSSLLTRYGLDVKVQRGVSEHLRGRRNLMQVLGQGLVAAVLAAAAAAFPVLGRWLTTMFASAVASSNSDTWAAELGPLTSKPARLITRLRETVPHGTSGAVSHLGELGSVGGGLLISAVGFATGLLDAWASLNVLISALVGSHVDSVAGASLQARYRCATCGKLTEDSVHCGRHGILVGGVRMITNEVVNFIATGVAAFTAALLAFLLFI